MPDRSQTGAPGARYLPWLLVAIAAVSYFTGLGAYTLFDPDEGRYAEMPREILQTGDFITPRLNYAHHYHKPPLYYWLGAGCMAVFGANEFAARLAPALSGFLTFLVVGAFGGRVISRRGGLLAAGAFLTSLVPLGIARVPNTDTLFALTLTATWACWFLGYNALEPRVSRRWYIAAWVFLGLATMTKGIVALVLTGAIVLCFLVLRRDLMALGKMAWWAGVPLFLLITLPWYVAVSLRNPDFLHYHFVVQHFARFFGGQEFYVGEEHTQPVWFFPVVILAGLGGWMMLAFPAGLESVRAALAGVRLLRRDGEREKGDRGANDRVGPEGPTDAGVGGEESPKVSANDRVGPVGPTDAIAGRGALALFLVVWLVVVVGFFSLSAAKLSTYVLPAFPAVALLLGMYVEGGGLQRRGARAAAALMGLLAIAIGVAVPSLAQDQDLVPGGIAAAAAVPLQWAAIVAGMALLATAFLRPSAIGLAAGAFTLGFLFSALHMLPQAVPYLQAGYLVKHLPVELPPEVKIVHWHTYDQSVGFYTRRRVALVDKSGELQDRIGKPDAPPEWFASGAESIKRFAAEGPVLLVLTREDWEQARDWGVFRPLAANSNYVLSGNDELLERTGLAPWPQDSITAPPQLLMPGLRTRALPAS